MLTLYLPCYFMVFHEYGIRWTMFDELNVVLISLQNPRPIGSLSVCLGVVWIYFSQENLSKNVIEFQKEAP